MAYLVTFYFISLDFVTGFLQAVALKTFSSKVMRQGLFHKAALVMVMLLGWLVDYAQQFVDLGVEVPVGGAVCVYIILMEVGSSLENIGKMNPEVMPQLLREIFGAEKRKNSGQAEGKQLSQVSRGLAKGAESAPIPSAEHRLEKKGVEECELRH